MPEPSRLVRLTALCLLLCTSLDASRGLASVLPVGAEADFVPGEIVVRVRDAGVPHMEALARKAAPGAAEPSRLRGQEVQRLRKAFSARDSSGAARARGGAPDAVYVLELDAGADLREAAAALMADPDVIYAEPNAIYRVQVALPPGSVVPTDPYVTRDGHTWSEGAWGQGFADLWGLQASRVLEAWSRFDLDASGAFEADERRPGEGVVIAVVDSGVDLAHPDLAGAAWRNPGEIPANGLDDDGNGFVDDVHGWDFVDADPIVEDAFGHGTHVAGTLAGSADRFGIAGVAPWAELMAVKGIGDRGSGTAVELARAVRYAADNGADIISSSWGGPVASDVIANAFAYARAQGVILVASAGNLGTNVQGTIPASLPGVVAVAALDAQHRPGSFTNRGARIDISAPGVEVLSSSANAGENGIADLVPGRVVDPDHLRLNGTSMACPHVAGALAVLRSRFPDESSDALVGRLLAGSVPLEAEGFETLLGEGRLDLLGALDATPHPLVQRSDAALPSLVPGERTSLVVELVNRWTPAPDVQARLVSLDPSVRVLEAKAVFGALETTHPVSNGASPFVLETDVGMAFGTHVDFQLHLTGGGVDEVLPLTLVASYFEDIGAQSGLPLSDPIAPVSVNFADIDGDERPDLHWVGTALNRLFRNVDGEHFEDLTFDSGAFVNPLGASGGIFLDAEGDGDPDLVVGNQVAGFESSLLINRGDGSFENRTAESPIRDVRISSGVATDADRDGKVDLLGIGVSYWSETAPHPQASALLRGDGRGGFQDITPTSCLPYIVSLVGGQMISFDYDSDGDADLAMTSPNLDLQVYRRDPGGVYTNVTRRLGLARSLREEAACRVDSRLREGGCEFHRGSALAAGDYDGDGDIDLFMSGYRLEGGATAALYRNEAGERYRDVTSRAGELVSAESATPWGTAFWDYDNDGDLDLHVTNDTRGQRSANSLYRNEAGHFMRADDEVFPSFPIGLGPQAGASAIVDLDGDGALDLYSPTSTFLTQARGMVLRNRGAQGRHWLGVRLRGIASTPEAYGARVRVGRRGVFQTREVHTSPVSTQPLHFGLGDADRVNVVVRWPSGLLQTLRRVSVDRVITIEEPVHCMKEGSEHRGRRSVRECRGVRYEPPDETPVPVRVPRWAERLLPEQGPICHNHIQNLKLRRLVCRDLLRECRLRAAKLPGRKRENMACVLPDVAAFGCEDTPYWDRLQVCDCFDYPEPEEAAGAS